MVGLGRMGANMVRRLMKAGHRAVVYDLSAAAVDTLRREGATGASSFEELAKLLQPPRPIWMMVPAAAVDATIANLRSVVRPGDILIDGGNSRYQDDLRRATELEKDGVHYVDVGTSGGVWGLERGYCLMIGGEREVVNRLDPIFASLAPGMDAARADSRGAGEPSTAERGYVHCGPVGAGHFVKMVHNGIEYGLMEAYAEGLNVLKHANVGKRTNAADAETTPLAHPEHYQYDLDLAAIAEVWRHGSVVASWLLDLIAMSLAKDSSLECFTGHVSDSGEGRWTLMAAIDEAVPVPVLSAALYQRFGSRGQTEFADRLLSAMRYAFGGHEERQPESRG